MFFVPWLRGMFRRQPARLAGLMVGIALTVSLLCVIGQYISSSTAIMTQRVVREVPVDWQVQLTSGSDLNKVKSMLGATTHYRAMEQVGYADVTGFEATTGKTTQTTGAGKVIGLNSSYTGHFPAQIRPLVGAHKGILIAQQTAANLHVKVGDPVTIFRVGLPPATVKIDGVVDLPNADSLFQAIGIPQGMAPQAPPDNVMILPSNIWQQLFSAQAVLRPDSVHYQLHVKISNRLPADPNKAFNYVQQLSNNFEARIAGSGMVGNNLAARLGAAREDANYAYVLFLFLGLPGVIVAVLLTLAITSVGENRRRLEQGLLRTRGASVAQVLGIEAVEAVLAAIGGTGMGLLLTWLLNRWLGIEMSASKPLLWAVISSVAGFVVAFAPIELKAWKTSRTITVTSSKTGLRKVNHPFRTVGIGLVLLVVGAVDFWQVYSTGYQIVLAPEGVASTSVHYEAFLAPVCFWIGGLLVIKSLFDLLIMHKRKPLKYLFKPVAGKLSEIVASSISRQRSLIISGILMVVLAVSFATSTGIFNSTYNAQSWVDAMLTNGADVTVTGSTSLPAGDKIQTLRHVPGVIAAQPMQHRYAYVGNDLQDLYGIDPANIGQATAMSNAYFKGGDYKSTLSTLSRVPNGVLVSEETVKDFNLVPGDQINLRLQNATDHQYHVVPFLFVGVAREFPTAPKDSFLVANSEYIASVTGNRAAEVVLLRTNGNSARVAKNVRNILGPLAGMKVTDVGTTSQIISSGLTAVDLHGLTKVELLFALILIAGAGGLTFALGMAERRKTHSILNAIGATQKQMGAFVWSEGMLIISGLIPGLTLGVGISWALVKLLSGVFDPPPDHLSVPWLYLLIMVVATLFSTGAAVLGTVISSHRTVDDLRNVQ